MLDVVTFHSQSISFNALLSILLKFSTSLKGILAKKLLRKKVPNCTKFKTQFKICALFLLIWKIGGLIKFFLGGQRICTHLLKLTKLETCFKHFCTFKTQLVRDFVWSFWNFVNLWNLKHFAPQQNNWSEFGLELLKLCKTYETLKLVVSSILHLEKKTCQRCCLELLKLCATREASILFQACCIFFSKTTGKERFCLLLLKLWTT